MLKVYLRCESDGVKTTAECRQHGFIMRMEMDGKTWGQMLLFFRERVGMTKSELARSVGVTISYISKLEDGKKPPPEDQRWAIGDALGMSEEEMEVFHIKAEIERSDPTAVKYLLRLIERGSESSEALKDSSIAEEPSENGAGELHTIAIINKAAAGYPQGFTDLDYPTGVADGYIAVPDISDPNAFGFYVSGDSMEPDFPDGLLLIASPNTVPFEGDPCFVRFSSLVHDGGCTFKRVYFTKDNRVRLVPINRKYAEETFDRQDIIGLWPVVRSYGKVNRGAERGQTRRVKSSGRSFEEGQSRTSTAAG